MDDEDVDKMVLYLDTPYSKIQEFKMNYRNPAQRKEAYLDCYVHNHPAASWTRTAQILRSYICGLSQQATVVENTYIQGIKASNLLYVNADSCESLGVCGGCP